MTNTEKPVAWQYRYKYDDFEWSNWAETRRPDADDLLESNVLMDEEARPLYTQDQLDAAVRAERERCAKIAETFYDWRDGTSPPLDDRERAQSIAASDIAAAIREGE